MACQIFWSTAPQVHSTPSLVVVAQAPDLPEALVAHYLGAPQPSASQLQGLISASTESGTTIAPSFTEFTQSVLRARHEGVINALYIDKPRQCKTWGMRFGIQGEHNKHGLARDSKQEEKAKTDEEQDDDCTVPAYENQRTCALCLEPFQDFFNDEMDEWVYRGAVYKNVASGTHTQGMSRLKRARYH